MALLWRRCSPHVSAKSSREMVDASGTAHREGKKLACEDKQQRRICEFRQHVARIRAAQDTATLLVSLPRFLMLVRVDDDEWVTAHGLCTFKTEAQSQCDIFLPRRQPIACCPSVDLVIDWTARHFMPASNDRMEKSDCATFRARFERPHRKARESLPRRWEQCPGESLSLVLNISYLLQKTACKYTDCKKHVAIHAPHDHSLQKNTSP